MKIDIIILIIVIIVEIFYQNILKLNSSFTRKLVIQIKIIM